MGNEKGNLHSMIFGGGIVSVLGLENAIWRGDLTMDHSESIQKEPRVSLRPEQQESSLATSGLNNLPSYPSEAEPDVVIRARIFPIVEITASALLGTVFGVAIGVYLLVNGSDVNAFLICLGVALLVGVIIGLAVGHFTGPTGELSIRTVLAAVLRVIFAATVGLMFVMVFAMMGIVFVPRRSRRDDESLS